MKAKMKELVNKKIISTINYLALKYALNILDALENGTKFEDVYTPFCLFAMQCYLNEDEKSIREYINYDKFYKLLENCLPTQIPDID